MSPKTVNDSDVVIIDALRTPIGRFQGGLSGVRPDDLAALTIRALLERTGVEAAEVEDVFFGCANQAGEDNRNVARMALLLAGMPQSVPGRDGQPPLRQRPRGREPGLPRRPLRRRRAVYIAGGVESMSRAPYSMPRGPQLPKAGNVTIYDTSLGWRYPNPKMEALFALEAMGQHRREHRRRDEDLAGRPGRLRPGVSHQKALAAQDAGAFEAEMISVTAPAGRKKTIELTADEGPRPGHQPWRSWPSSGRPSAQGGSRHRGQLLHPQRRRRCSAPLHRRRCGPTELGPAAHGAPALLRSRRRRPRDHGPTGPVPATRKAVQRAGLWVGDIDLFELNEAFAAQSLGVHPQARARPRQGQRARRRHRSGSSPGLLRRPHPHHPGPRHEAPRQAPGSARLSASASARASATIVESLHG